MGHPLGAGAETELMANPFGISAFELDAIQSVRPL